MLRFFLLIWMFPFVAVCQTTEIYNDSGRVILVFENDRLVEVPSKKVFVTVKGNTVFDGSSQQKKDILLLITTENIFSRKKIGYALNSAQDDAIFSISQGRFFYKESKGQMAYYRYEDDGSYVLYRDTSSNVLCHVKSELSTGKLVAVFYYFMRTQELDKLIKEEVSQVVEPQEKDITATSGSISRLWSTGLDEFTWDGQVFKRKWNSFDYEEWTFDGTTLKRLWYPGDEEFVWDGKILRRKWYQSNDEFEWDGTILRRRWGSTTDEFIIQGNIVRRYLVGSSEDEWKTEGEVPIPLIALVVFGLLRK